MLADGGDAISSIDVLRHQPQVRGTVPSPATLWRALDELRPRPEPWCKSSLDRVGGSLGGQRWCGGGLLFGRGGQCGSGTGEHVEAEVAAAFDPFVVLFG